MRAIFGGGAKFHGGNRENASTMDIPGLLLLILFIYNDVFDLNSVNWIITLWLSNGFYHIKYNIFSLIRTPGDRQNLFVLSRIRINRCIKY